MDMIKVLATIVLYSTSLFSADLVIDGQHKPITPQLQPTVDIVSPFGLELASDPEDIVTWTWSKGLSVWKTKENRLEIEAPKGVYRVDYLIRTINFSEGRIDRQTGQLVFSVSGGTTQPPPGNDPPDEVPDTPTDPLPDNDFKKFTDLAKEAVAKIKDKKTAGELGKFYTDWASSADKNKSIEILRWEVRRGVGNILLARTGDADWETDWRKPASDLLKTLTNPEDYIKAIYAAGVGLSSGANAILATPPRLYFYSSSDPNFVCLPCEQWKQNELRKFQAAGVQVYKRTTATEAVPQFVYVSPSGRRFSYMGYLAYDKFKKLTTETLWKEN